MQPDSEPITLYEVKRSIYEIAILLAVLFCLGSLMGCGGETHADTKAVRLPAPHERVTITILPDATWLAPPLAEDASPATPPAVIADTIFPPKAAVRLDANTYRACTCGDVCRCANCPDDCNTLARGDCPGGVCPVPQRSVLTRSTVNHAQVASGDCDSGACGGLRQKALAPVRFIREKKPVRKAGGFVWRLFRM